jgi:hypothetical protein
MFPLLISSKKRGEERRGDKRTQKRRREENSYHVVIEKPTSHTHFWGVTPDLTNFGWFGCSAPWIQQL